jgi:hypothetical protein
MWKKVPALPLHQKQPGFDAKKSLRAGYQPPVSGAKVPYFLRTIGQSLEDPVEIPDADRRVRFEDAFGICFQAAYGDSSTRLLNARPVSGHASTVGNRFARIASHSLRSVEWSSASFHTLRSKSRAAFPRTSGPPFPRSGAVGGSPRGSAYRAVRAHLLEHECGDVGPDRGCRPCPGRSARVPRLIRTRPFSRLVTDRGMIENTSRLSRSTAAN